MTTDAQRPPPEITPPSNRGLMGGLVGKIAAATAILLAVGSFLDATIAVTTKATTLTCNLTVSFPWCPTPPVISANLPPGMSLTCKYTTGPKAGQTQNFSGVQGAIPAPVGGPCGDGQGSIGTAVADGTRGATPGGPQAGTGRNSLPPGMSLTCKYTTGPKAGQTQDFAGVQGATPAPVGGLCGDGVGSSGYAE
jgi:hypothetical protein